MNDKPDVKKERGSGLKLLLFLSLSVFIIIGGYSIYKIMIQKTVDSGSRATVTPEPTIVPEYNLVYLQPTPTTEKVITTETPTALPTINISPPSTTPTKVPTPTVTVKPTITTSPTITAKPIYQVSPIPTQKSQDSLPVSGNSIPTILLFSLGIILFLPIIFLH